MRVLFCHDGPIRKDEQGNYYGIAHNNSSFKRYYNIADKLHIAMRVNPVSKKEAVGSFSKITIPAFKVFDVPNMSSIKLIRRNRKMAKVIIEKAVEKADYVVTRLPSHIGFHAFDCARKLNKPCLVEVVACAWDAHWNHSALGRLAAPYMYMATKTRVRNATHVVYVTNEFLQKRYPTNGKSTNCSNVSLEEFDEKIIKRRIEKINGMSIHGKIVVGTTAAVNVRYKGQQYIIEALGKLKKQGITNFEYQLVGGGDNNYLRSITKKFDVEDQVLFLGSLPHQKVFNWLDSIDIYAQPSRQEGLPRALIEAMSRGLPAFGANTAGIPELLEDKYIFSNTKNNINEICSILSGYNKETLKSQGKRNYNESKKYAKTIIEERRKDFFLNFKTD